MDIRFSPSTWRLLGSSVAIGYTGFGLLGLIQPTLSAKLLNLHPESDDLSSSSSPKSGSVDTTADHGEAAKMGAVLLASRDLSIGVALIALSRQRMPRAMGVVISAGMILCTMDVWWIWKARGPAMGGLFLAGASSWGLVGYGLLGLSEGESW